MSLRSLITQQPAARYLAVSAWIIIVVLSVLPGRLRPHTGFSGDWEHVAAYAGAAALTVIAFQRIPTALIIASFSAASAVFEVSQLIIPGRGTMMSNWAASTSGAAAGALMGMLVLKAALHWYQANTRR